MEDLNAFMEWIETREDDEQLVEWLQLINSVEEAQSHQVVTLH